jgi:hypothetical protein
MCAAWPGSSAGQDSAACTRTVCKEAAPAGFACAHVDSLRLVLLTLSLHDCGLTVTPPARQACASRGKAHSLLHAVPQTPAAHAQASHYLAAAPLPLLGTTLATQAGPYGMGGPLPVGVPAL